jgi:hypothetical protein
MAGTKPLACPSVQHETSARRGQMASPTTAPARAMAASICAARLFVMEARSEGSSASMKRMRSVRNVGLHTEISPRSSAARRQRAVSRRHSPRSPMRATVPGTASILRSAARSTGPKYSVSSSKPMRSPPRVRSASRAAGDTDQ